MVNAIEIEDATVVRGGKPVLRGISLSFKKGEHACILGPNGSGKSTIVKMISGDLSPLYREPAAIRLFGQERWELFALRSRLGIVSDTLQNEQTGDESALDTILSGFFGGVGLPLRAEATPTMIAKATETAELLGVRPLLGKRADELSSGEMRRVLVARALVHDPEMLLLDEPYKSLDIAARLSFGRCVNELAAHGHTIILVTHELSEISPDIERVILIKEGRIFADGPKREILQSPTISELFDIPLRVGIENGRYCSHHALAQSAIP
ncbi:MAG: ATP-binding cassette domain-containing protein [Rectinemataceae bacterium]|jgi:iron complex transport system ATP-binding protein